MPNLKGFVLFKPFVRAGLLWNRVGCVDLSAAFAYYSLQSLFPVLLIALAVSGAVLGADVDRSQRFLQAVSSFVPSTAFPAVTAGVDRFSNQAAGAGTLGVVVLALTSTNAYLTLQRGADRLWPGHGHLASKRPWLQLLRMFFIRRLKALCLVLVLGVFLVFDQLLTGLRALGPVSLPAWLLELLPSDLLLSPVSMGRELALTLFLSFALLLLLFWMLPSRRLPIRSLIPGAATSSMALTLLNLTLARILVLLGVRFQAYGLVGGVLLLTLWAWFVGVVLYYGLCLSVVLTSPSQGATAVLAKTPGLQ